jgi:hypothetical protein
MKKYEKYLVEKLQEEPSPILNVYGSGERFDISDNEDLFQMVKMIKDMIDKHFYSSNFKYSYKVDYQTLVFEVESQKNSQEVSMVNHLIVDDLVNMVETGISRRYQNLFKISRETCDIGEGKEIIKIIIKKIDKFPYLPDSAS